MTPKPDNLPAPADMDLTTLLREMARVLHNAGGAAHGAGYSADLADAAIARAEKLPGWKPIETAQRDIGPHMLGRPDWDCPAFAAWQNGRWGGDIWVLSEGAADVQWYDFGNGAPLPAPPQAPEAAQEADHG